MSDLPNPPIDQSSLKNDLDLMTEAAVEAGKIASSFFNAENEVWYKSGDSPVSQADFAVDKFLKEQLLKARPKYGWLSEESEDEEERLSKEYVFVVDPIDGTRGFLAGKKQWCISIGLVKSGRPIAGVIECPALQETYTASFENGAFLNGNKITTTQSAEVDTITGSRNLNAQMKKLHDFDLQVLDFVPSLAYRLVMVANNQVDAGLVRPSANDWDLAAADIILHEAGGMLTDLKIKKKTYNQKSTMTGSLVACGKNKHKSILALAETLGFSQ